MFKSKSILKKCTIKSMYLLTILLLRIILKTKRTKKRSTRSQNPQIKRPKVTQSPKNYQKPTSPPIPPTTAHSYPAVSSQNEILLLQKVINNHNDHISCSYMSTLQLCQLCHKYRIPSPLIKTLHKSIFSTSNSLFIPRLLFYPKVYKS